MTKPTSDKVSEARQNVIYGGTSQCKCAYTKARERCSTCTIEAVDNLIAAVRAAGYPFCDKHKDERALMEMFGQPCIGCIRETVRAEQPQVGLYRNKLLKGLHGILTDANHPTPEDIDDIDGILTAVRIAVGPWPEAQPPAIGHVANCRCCSTHDDCNHHDPRCSPGLLREAEVRLNAIDTAERLCLDPIDLANYRDEARAEVERLKK